MKLNFKKVHDVLIPTTDTGEEIENIKKCTVSSSFEQETIMTITVSIKEKTVENSHKA